MIRELKCIPRSFSTFYNNAYIIFAIKRETWSYNKWSHQPFCTCEKRLIHLSKKNFRINTDVKELQTIMKEESDKPLPKLNFKALINHKRKINIEIVTELKEKKPRAKVDLQSMKEELKQLEDPPATPWEKQISAARLPYSFYDVPCEILAKNLLGKILVRKLDNGAILKGRIVETESYLGVEDKASHTFGGKVTLRNTPMYMHPGTIYVYFTYGMYHCFNLSSQEEGSAVLVRALEPLEGIKQMIENRSWRPKAKLPKKLLKVPKLHELCNGPSKICMAMGLEKKHSKYSICNWKNLWIEDDGIQTEMKIVECSRIGIESAGEEWANKPLRYYIYGHKCVSKRDKKAESVFQSN